MKKKIASLIVAIVVALIPVTAFAISAPDSISIPSAKAVRNVVQTGDIAIFFEYNMAYASYPSAPPTATDAVIMRLYKPDGTTLIASANPFAKFHNGWGIGVIGFYFSASQVTALGLAWNDADTININGSPAYFSSFIPANYTLQPADYSSVTDQAGNRAVLHNWVIEVAKVMEVENAVKLQGAADNNTVLSDTGEVYFKGALPGLQAMCPDLFYTQFYVPTPTSISYNTNLADTYSHRLDGTDLQVGLDRLGTYLGISGQMLIAALFALGLVALLIFSNRKLGGIEPGIFIGGLLMSMGALLFGGSLMTLRILMAFMAGCLFVYMIIFKKA